MDEYIQTWEFIRDLEQIEANGDDSRYSFFYVNAKLKMVVYLYGLVTDMEEVNIFCQKFDWLQ